MKEIAIIGPTASGKSDLALEAAKKHNAYILSIDSLSIYKEIDIASAKPSANELGEVEHFGINVLSPSEHFSVATFTKVYKKALSKAVKDSKNLIIVGGTGFYLKSLMSGLSEIPEITHETRAKAKGILKNLHNAYGLLFDADPDYMRNIEKNDSYRIEKMLLLYFETGKTPSEWFKENPPTPIIQNLELFEIDVKREVLRERISKRTKKMVGSGLIDEVAYLEQKYTRAPNCMKAIGITEVLDYLDGKISKEEMTEAITTHTAQLAKRQQTFNRNQFEKRAVFGSDKILKEIDKIFS
ncbi:MAG: tRNA (adenosine(37)-N6)-dimethylallyltransferase MiaA [Helicobacteraceae bacterium 4484_230]|nr:MAG: tRNA (adenosine(37)-N6)-dimethylallyltransferase MiaA [Helicobacteraceae bacterium 4484_230]